MNEAEERRAFWDAWATKDPHYAIQPDPGKQDGRWDTAEFFRGGEDIVQALMEKLELDEGEPVDEPALDFGCGVGRLTRPLATFFGEVVGCDISPLMIEKARAVAPVPPNCRFIVNTGDGSIPLGTGVFCFAMAYGVFEHAPTEVLLKAVSEMLRVTRPGGLVYFTAPLFLLAYTRQGAFTSNRAAHPGGTELKVQGHLAGMERPIMLTAEETSPLDLAFPLYIMPAERIEEAVRGAGGVVRFMEVGNPQRHFEGGQEGLRLFTGHWFVRRLESP